MSTKKRSKKQDELPAMEGPGVAQVAIPAIDEAAEAYVKVRDRRMKLTEEEVTSYAVLAQTVESNKEKLAKDADGKIVYRYDDMKVEVKPGKAKIRVRRADSESSDEDS